MIDSYRFKVRVGDCLSSLLLLLLSVGKNSEGENGDVKAVVWKTKQKLEVTIPFNQ